MKRPQFTFDSHVSERVSWVKVYKNGAWVGKGFERLFSDHIEFWGFYIIIIANTFLSYLCCMKRYFLCDYDCKTECKPFCIQFQKY